MDKTISVLKALSDPGRLRIVIALMSGRELCACQITELLQLSGATVSRHLAQLTGCGLLRSRKEGRWIFFRLADDPSSAKLLSWLRAEAAARPKSYNDGENLKKIVACGPEAIASKQRENNRHQPDMT